MISVWLGRLKKFRNFIGPEVWRLFLVALVLGIFWFLIETMFVYIIQAFFASFGVMKANVQLSDYLPKEPWLMSVLLIVYGILRGGSFLLRTYFSNVASQAFVRHQKYIILRIALLGRDQFSTHEITTAFNDNVASSGLVLQNLSILICDAVAIILFILYGAFIAPMELVIGFALLFIILLPTKSLDRKVKELSNALHRERESVNRTLNLGIRNNFFLRLYGLIRQEIERGRTAIDAYKNHFQKYSLLSSTRAAFPLTVGVFVISLISFASITFFKTDGFKLMAFFYIFIRLAQNLSEAYSIWGEMRIQFPALQSLYHLNMLSQDVLKPEDQAVPNEMKESRALLQSGINLEVKNLCFNYGDNAVIKDVSFAVNPGQILVLHGESGAGKTTLLSLVVGTLSPTSGQVLINGQPADQVSQALGQEVGYAGPEPYLIPGTIKENMNYGMPIDRIPTSEEPYWAALRFAEMESVVRQLPHGLDEFIHEWAQLSTGQRQRLSIARAILRKPKLVIFDEATANLDEKTERNIVQEIQKMSEHSTVLIVSHKTSFDAIATQIIHLKSRQST